MLSNSKLIMASSNCSLLNAQIQIQPLQSHFTRGCSPFNSLFPLPSASASASTTINQQRYRRLHLSFARPYRLQSPLTTHVCRPHSSLNPLSSPKPPSSKEEAISQVRTCLATTLQKPITNPRQLTTKFKRQKQPRYRIEIPVTDDSPESITQLALQIFHNLPIKRKGGSPIKTLIVWPTSTLLETGIQTFKSFSSSSSIHHTDLQTATTFNTIADFAVFVTPSPSQLPDMSVFCDSIDPTPIVLFNPQWSFDDEEADLSGGLKPFVRSFEVVYAFLGLEVRGILSKRTGVVFKCAKDGVVSGESWNVFVEEEGGDKSGELKVVTKFKLRPSMVEVESVLYNLMAVNSPITKSAKFFRDLVSNVTGKK